MSKALLAACAQVTDCCAQEDASSNQCGSMWVTCSIASSFPHPSHAVDIGITGSPAFHNLPVDQRGYVDSRYGR